MNKPLTNPWIFDVHYEDFDAKVIERSHTTPVLVDLWAEWCSPCLVIAPVLERVLTEFQGRVLLAKVEVDEGENMKLAGHYLVRGFPTILLFEAGEVVDRFSGAKPLHFIHDFIEQKSRLLSRG